MSVSTLIQSKLMSLASVRTAVNGNITQDTRSDKVPALEWAAKVNSVDSNYTASGIVFYSLNMAVVCKRLSEADAIADDLVTALDHCAEYTDGTLRLLHCTFEDRTPDTIDRAGSKDRLAVVDLRFDLAIRKDF